LARYPTHAKSTSTLRVFLFELQFLGFWLRSWLSNFGILAASFLLLNFIIFFKASQHTQKPKKFLLVWFLAFSMFPQKLDLQVFKI